MSAYGPWLKWYGDGESPVGKRKIVQTMYKGMVETLQASDVNWDVTFDYRVSQMKMPKMTEPTGCSESVLVEHLDLDIGAGVGANDIQTGGSHYKDMAVQPWDVIDHWPLEQQVGYHRGNVLKYTMRMGSKDERLKEARKIAHYAQKLVEVLEKIDG